MLEKALAHFHFLSLVPLTLPREEAQTSLIEGETHRTELGWHSCLSQGQQSHPPNLLTHKQK